MSKPPRLAGLKGSPTLVCRFADEPARPDTEVVRT
jgi:hypothetical protein